LQYHFHSQESAILLQAYKPVIWVRMFSWNCSLLRQSLSDDGRAIKHTSRCNWQASERLMKLFSLLAFCLMVNDLISAGCR
jgi:hypothetical protein